MKSSKQMLVSQVADKLEISRLGSKEVIEFFIFDDLFEDSLGALLEVLKGCFHVGFVAETRL